MRLYPRLWRDTGGNAEAIQAMRNRFPGASTARACRRPCLPALPATRWIAPLVDLEAKSGGCARPCSRPTRTAPLHHGVHNLVSDAGSDGGRHRQGLAPAAAQDQALAATATPGGSLRSARLPLESELIVDANEA